jgi:hypothetical protein
MHKEERRKKEAALAYMRGGCFHGVTIPISTKLTLKSNPLHEVLRRVKN